MMIPIPAAGMLCGVRGLHAAKATPGVEDVRITIPRGERVVPLVAVAIVAVGVWVAVAPASVPGLHVPG
jgi:hypothetical protein